MVIRKMKLIRQQAKITAGDLALYMKVSEYKILSYENLSANGLNRQDLKKIARKLKTTVKELTKCCEVERQGKSSRNFKYKIIREDLTKEEIEIEVMLETEKRRKKVRESCEKKRAEVKKAKPKKKEIKPGEAFRCRNEACLLNSSNTGGCCGQKCMCDSPIVTSGNGECACRDIKKPKQEQIDNKIYKNWFSW